MYSLCGLNLNRHILLVTVLFVPMGTIFWNSKYILIQLGQQEGPAIYCQRYLRAALPGLYLNCVQLSLTIFLTAMENSFVPMVIQAVLIAMHLIFTYVMVVLLN